MSLPMETVVDRPEGLARLRDSLPGAMQVADETRVRAAPLVDVLAPALLVYYFVLTFRPFELTFWFPGFASSVIFPALTVGLFVITPTERLARIPVPWALMGYIGWLALTYLWTEIPFSTIYLMRSQLIPLLMVPLLTSTIEPRVVVRVLLGLASVVAVWSLFHSVAFSSSRAVDLGGREGLQLGFRGTFGHKNILGIFMVYALCIVLPFKEGRWRKPLILLCVVLVIGTRSATAGSGLFAVCFTWFWIAAIKQQTKPRERQFLFVLSIASALGAMLLAFGFLPSLLDLYQKDLTFSGRTDIWAASLESVWRRPVQGYGYGGVWLDGANPVTRDLQTRIGFGAAHAHNGVIEIMLQVGLVGLGLLLVILGRTFRLLGWAMGSPATAPYGQWALLTLIALLLMQVSEPLFEGGHLALVMVLWAVLSRLFNDARRGSSPRGRAFPTVL